LETQEMEYESPKILFEKVKVATCAS